MSALCRKGLIAFDDDVTHPTIGSSPQVLTSPGAFERSRGKFESCRILLARTVQSVSGFSEGVVYQAGRSCVFFTYIFSTHEIWTDVVRNTIVFITTSRSVDYKRIIIGTIQMLAWIYDRLRTL